MTKQGETYKGMVIEGRRYIALFLQASRLEPWQRTSEQQELVEFECARHETKQN